LKRENVTFKILYHHHVRMFDLEFIGITVNRGLALLENPRHPKALWAVNQGTRGLLDACGEIANVPYGDERWMA
jgi:hypothetical protein